MIKQGIFLKRSRFGFTLTEILIVVIIIGILSTLALPMLVKTLEKAKLGEAVSNLNLIRTGEKIYLLEYGTFWQNLDALNIENPNSSTKRYFEYTVESANADNFIAKATRKDGKYSGKGCYIDKNGTITADSEYLTP